MDIDLIQKYKSHPDKLLHDHLKGVTEKARKHWDAKIVEVVSLFHDLGKINPNFQKKLEGMKNGYANHSYLSAFAWLLFFQSNSELFESWFGRKPEIIFSIATIIAKHHGNLPDMGKGFFAEEPRIALFNYLKDNPQLAISEFLQVLLPHKQFSFVLPTSQAEVIINEYQFKFLNIKKHIHNSLEFFHDTQFAFACLIEADKRDAANNHNYQRVVVGRQLRELYARNLGERLNQYVSDNSLNCLRSEIRTEALRNLKSKLDNAERVFTLTSPTGSGKTMMLLALANEIIIRNPEHDILYALPFLSITEQVDAIAKDIFGKDLILRVDSKSENKKIQTLLEQSDSEPEKYKELLSCVFSEETFDHPFIITTFVRLYETLVSNQNSDLLKLSNFSKRVFLVDEVQALPPRLYIFFAALLDEFCVRFDSYAILSTATMPYLEINDKTHNGKVARNLFKNYPLFDEAKRRELLNADSHFSNDIFNRYSVMRIDNDAFTIDDLADIIGVQEKSCLVILNTIQDTKDLYEKFQDQCDVYVLLNTHFHLEDRKAKISYCKDMLERGKRVVLISTQLIEAGVDIDFPVLYRDLCPLPNLIQSAGRCNRNGSSEKGKVYLFELRDREKKGLRANLIYRDEVGKKFLSYCKNNINGQIFEKDLFRIQTNFFKTEVGDQLMIGKHYQSHLKIKNVNNAGQEEDVIDMMKCIEEAQFETLGQFRLVDENVYGEEHRYYVPMGGDDEAFDKLTAFYEKIKVEKKFNEAKMLNVKIEKHLRSMSERVVVIRLHESQTGFLPQATDKVFGIKKLVQKDGYSFEKGICLKGIENSFI